MSIFKKILCILVSCIIIKKAIKNITIKIPYLIEKNMMGENDI
jgi:hypothetical protein